MSAGENVNSIWTNKIFALLYIPQLNISTSNITNCMYNYDNKKPLLKFYISLDHTLIMCLITPQTNLMQTMRLIFPVSDKWVKLVPLINDIQQNIGTKRIH